MIDGISNDSYILFINPGTIFTQSWDTKLTMFANNNLGKALSISDNIFDLSGTFIKKDILNKISYPRYLKQFGEEEDISIKLYCSNIQITSGIKEIIQPCILRNWDYIPFSSSHRYDQVVKLYENGFNAYCKIDDNYKQYALMYPIKQIFDQLDDPIYLSSSLDIGKTPYEVFNSTKHVV